MRNSFVKLLCMWLGGFEEVVVCWGALLAIFLSGEKKI